MALGDDFWAKLATYIAGRAEDVNDAVHSIMWLLACKAAAGPGVRHEGDPEALPQGAGCTAAQPGRDAISAIMVSETVLGSECPAMNQERMDHDRARAATAGIHAGWRVRRHQKKQWSP